MKKKIVYIKQKNFRKKDIPKLNYGMIHSQVGFNDGVSIVMNQIESVMVKNMEIPMNSEDNSKYKEKYYGKPFSYYYHVKRKTDKT